MPGYNRLRLPEAYRALANLSARGFAWEWLRRNYDFRQIWTRHGDLAKRPTALAHAAVHRSARPFVDIRQHPLSVRWSPWGLTFRRSS